MRKRAYLAIAVGLALAAGLEGSASPTPPKGFMGEFDVASDDPLLGGVSGIEVSSNGTNLTLISDAGAIARGSITRDGTGHITKVSLAPLTLLKGLDDAPLKRLRNDSEGLAIAADGTIFISFEGVARVLRYAEPEASAQNLPSPKDFAKLQNNSALEALAIDAEGTLYTTPERSGGLTKPFPVFRFKNGAWDKTLSIPRRDNFLAVSLDIGPDGRLYLLERQFRGLPGFATRLRRFDVTQSALTNEKVMLETAVGTHDNLEGLSLWRNSAGKLVATMIADDNYNLFFTTQIVEYQLDD